MQKLAEICIKRPVFAAMIILALVVVGAASYFRLGVDRFPSVDLPTVSVRTGLPGASSEEVETLVSQPIEEAVNTVEGIDELRSVSGPGVSLVIATFKLDRDLETAAQDVRDRVSTVLNRLPEEARERPPVVQKFNNDSAPVITIALTGDRSLRELTELGDKTVRPQFERVGGVGAVQVVGGLERAINVLIDADRLEAYQIPITAVQAALGRQNADIPGGNTIEVIEGVKKAIARVEAQLPSDVKLEVIRDQSRYIEAALHEITVHLVLGSILASLVVLVFMRSWRSTLIAAVAIPASVVSTFAMMRALDFTLNSVTMLALVLMVGVVIDDAIVVLENIFRFVEEKRMTAMEAAREATADIGLAVLATTLSLVVIFLPVSFMSSISARLLRAEDASGHGGGHHDGEYEGGAKAGSRGGFYGYIDRAYTRLLTFSMRHRLAVSVLAMLVVASSVPLYRAVRQEFIPSNVDEAEFEVNVNAPEGTNLAVMNETMQAIEQDIMKTHGVRLVLATAGGGFLGGVGQGDMYVRIAPHEERTLSFGRLWRETLNGTPLQAFHGNYTQQDVMQEMRRRLQKYAPMRVGVRNAQSFNFGAGGRFDIDFVIRGPELEQLSRYAEELRDRSARLGGIVDADTTLKLNKPELRVEIDRERAAALGVSTADVANSLRVMVGGDQEVTRYHDASVNEAYDVQLRLTEHDRNDPRTLGQLYVPSSRGGLVRLDNLVRIRRDVSPRAST